MHITKAQHIIFTCKTSFISSLFLAPVCLKISIMSWDQLLFTSLKPSPVNTVTNTHKHREYAASSRLSGSGPYSYQVPSQNIQIMSARLSQKEKRRKTCFRHFSIYNGNECVLDNIDMHRMRSAKVMEAGFLDFMFCNHRCFREGTRE